MNLGISIVPTREEGSICKIGLIRVVSQIQHTLVLGGPVTTVLWVYQRRATGVTPRETNNLLAEIILDFL